MVVVILLGGDEVDHYVHSHIVFFFGETHIVCCIMILPLDLCIMKLHCVHSQFLIFKFAFFNLVEKFTALRNSRQMQGTEQVSC